MSESAYRASPIGLKSCTACGMPTDPARLVYAKSGDLVCSSCETNVDGEARLARGALGSAMAAFVFGFFGTIALCLLVPSVLGLFALASSGRDETRMVALWAVFLTVMVALAIRTIAGAHRTLGAPAVRRALGGKRGLYLLLSWAGIPAVPFVFVGYSVFVFLVVALRNAF